MAYSRDHKRPAWLFCAFKGKLKLLSTKKKIQQQKFKVNAEVDQLYLQLVNCSGFKEDNATYRW